MINESVINDQLNLALISAASPINLHCGLLHGDNNSKYFHQNGNASKNPCQHTDFYLNMLPKFKALMNQSYLNCIKYLKCKKWYVLIIVPLQQPPQNLKESLNSVIPETSKLIS